MMKKSWIIGYALLAVLFAGCQTAQKKSGNLGYEKVTEDQLNFPGYGSDRMPAGSVDPVFGDVFKALRGVTIRGTIHAEGTTGSKEFLNYINRMKTQEILDLKDAKFATARKEWEEGGKKGVAPRRGEADRLSEEDVKGINPDHQAKIADQFLHSKGVADLRGLNAIRSKIDAQVEALANADAKTYNLSGAMRSKIVKDEFGNTRNIHQKIEANTQFSELMKGFATMAEKDPWFGSLEGKALLNNTRLEAGRIYQVTGMSNLTAKTCENLDRNGMEKYYELLRDIRSEFADVGADGKLIIKKDRVNCHNIDVIMAWVAAKFQERLGRTGLSALTAVREMTICDYLHPEAANGADKLASRNSGQVGDAPVCE